MRKDWKYILYITGAIGLFVVVKLLSPHQYDWRVTYAPEDKNPYGAYALNELLSGVFPATDIRHSYKTLYEEKDSLRKDDKLFILSTQFTAEKEDRDVLLKHIGAGGSAFISAQYFNGKFADTLQLKTNDSFFSGGALLEREDSAILKFATPNLDTAKAYYFRQNTIHNYFSDFDTTRTTVVAWNDSHQPVTIRVKWGEGNFILNCTPMMFTNINLLARDNHAFASTTLSYLPNGPFEWNEYYQRGRMEITTPLRFILTTESLRWAYYIGIIAILLFMIFEMKRKQRIIPVIKPLENTTLEFVSTIGSLYYQNAEHKNIAEKKIHYFLDQIRTKYWMNTSTLDETFIQNLTRKTGTPEELVRDLVKSILAIQSASRISAEDLIIFSKKLEGINY